MSNPPVTATLARFVAETHSLPAAAAHAGRRTILNAVALAVGAAEHPVVARVRETFAALGGPPQASVLGRDDRLPAAWAAITNGTAVHVEDFDDTHLPTIVHPGASVVPAALATAQLRGATAGAFVDAVCVGVEVALRVANGLCPAHFDRGWHPTGTMGVLGAAAAAGRILGQDAETLRATLGLAGTQSAGLLAALGTMTKAFHPGKAAGNGLEAALLVERGFSAPLDIIEGRRGLGEVAGPSPDYGAMLDGLEETWELDANAFKPYACGIVSHPVLDAARELRGAAPSGTRWRDLTVHVNPIVLDVMGVREPTDGLSSKFSVYHCVALGLSGYAGGPESFTDEVATDEALAARRELVSVHLDASVRRDEAHLEGIAADGTRHRVHIEHATGSHERPLSDDELVRKALLVAEPVLGSDAAARLAERCLDLGGDTSIEHLVEAATTAATAVGTARG